MRNHCALSTQLNTMITSAILLNTHNDVSKKARSKGHIATKLYNVAKAHPTTTTRNNSHKCSAAALRNKRSDNRKDLMFHVFPKNPCRRLISPLSIFQRTFVYYNCSSNIFWG